MMKAFRYERPNLDGRPRVTEDICNTDAMNTFVTVTTVGELHLHSHPTEDATWFVIGGTAAFYDEDDTKYVLEAGDFMCIPRGTKYWFEAVGGELLEIMRVSCRDLQRSDPVDPNRQRGNPNVRARELHPAPKS